MAENEASLKPKDDLPTSALEAALAALPPEKRQLELAGAEIVLAMVEIWELTIAALIGRDVLDERFRDNLLSHAKIQRDCDMTIRAAIVEKLADAIPGMVAAARAGRMPTQGSA